MIGLAAAALLLGLAGSLHCAAMCGAFVVVTRGHPAWHVGRVTTYALLGAAAGALGALGGLGAWAGPVRIGVGVLGSALLVLGAAQLLGLGSSTSGPAKPLKPLAGLLRRVATEQERAPMTRHLLLGLATGLLPCGLIYAALGLAATAGGPLPGAVVAAGLGLGTLPATVAMAFGARAGLKLGERRVVRGAVAGLALAVGLASIWVRVPASIESGVPCHSPEAESVPNDTESAT